MKKGTIPKIMFFILTALSLLTIPVSAANGDIAGAVRYTDIRASVNGNPIESYNVDGYTAVCAEDLAGYGFSVVWHDSSRLLQINVYKEYESSPPEYTYPENSQPVGTYRMPYLETDIQVLAGGTILPCWNIDGRTLVRLKDLAVFGTVVWDPEARTSTLTTFGEWTMQYDVLTPPMIGEELPEIAGFDLIFARDEADQFHMDGEHASYFTPFHILWDFSAKGASVRISFFQNDMGLDLISEAIGKCADWDYRGNFALTPQADIAELITLSINGEEKEIHTVGITQGNGHLDYILSVDGSYPREEVASVRLICRIPDGK